MEIILGKAYKYFLDYDEGQELFLVNREDSVFETLNGNIVFKKKSDPSRFYRADVNVFSDEREANNKAHDLNIITKAEITCTGCMTLFVFDDKDDDFHISGVSDKTFFNCPVCGAQTCINDDTRYHNEARGSYYKKEYLFYLDVARINKRKKMAKEAKSKEIKNDKPRI